MTLHPTQEPVTGREELGDLSLPLQALSQFYRALNSRDLAMLADNWDASEEASMGNPVGGIKRGWSEIEAVYKRIFQGGAEFRFEFHDYTLHQSADHFHVVGSERGHYEVRGERLALAIRTTRIFRRKGARWHQIHHHGSIDDPASLRAYQNAVAQS